MDNAEKFIKEMRVASFMSFGKIQQAKDLIDGLIFEVDPVRYEKENIHEKKIFLLF